MEKMETMQKKETPLGQSYWWHNGVYQSNYDSLYDQLVPAQGYAPTIHGEMSNPEA